MAFFLRPTFRFVLPALLIAAALSSCTEKSKTDQEVLPKVTELGPDGRGLEPVKPVEAPGEPAINPRARLSVERLMFRRRDWKVDVALRSLEEAKIDGTAKEALKLSGFYVSELPLERLGLFRANLPERVSVSVSRIMPMPDYSPVVLISRITGERACRAADREGELQVVKMTGGAYQLLARLAADKEGHTLVDLVPQHYVPKISAEIRTPGERLMDGRVFESMRVKQAIGAGKAWLIWSEAPAAARSRNGAGPAADPTGMEMEDAESTEPLPGAPLLGTMMLNGLRGQETVRMVVVVYVTE
ncbi:MAG: hypothetical protein ACYC26_07390 [Phycisphaerales bacterium]